jgi:N-carbamoyl-L-amino-acid hydrolase
LPLSLDHLNTVSEARFVELLAGIYEHSPWIVAHAAARRPFVSLAHLKQTLVRILDEADPEARLALVRAHPELAGRAMVAGALTAESTREQDAAGLTACTPAEFDRLQQLNARYVGRFGFPFVLAVRGPRGRGLSRAEIIATLERRLEHPPDVELAECVRNVHRIAELRLGDAFDAPPLLGDQVLDWADALAVHSDPGFRERGQLTVTYLTDAHRACAAQLIAWMRECGFDETELDAVGNVVGRYRGAIPGARRLLTGSHYDTVRNGGRYDGRLGILVPMLVVRELHRRGRRLPFGIEVVGFAEEEGQRYKATFLGSGALLGAFDPAWLEQRDAAGIPMREAMAAAGLHPSGIPAIRRDPADYLGFVEVHIEQGPVLAELGLPLGVVTSINGSVRHLVEIRGTACHAGTTPMDRRRDAACAAAELVLQVERRAAATPGGVGTVGQLHVPDGSINVVPGRCLLSIDIRATDDASRDACLGDVLAELDRICARRGVSVSIERTLQVPAAPSSPAWQARWEAAVASLGLPVHRMPSGAGHDAMKLHELMPQAMLFMRGLNLGISHNPLEAITSDDADLVVRAFQALVEGLAADLG